MKRRDCTARQRSCGIQDIHLREASDRQEKICEEKRQEKMEERREKTDAKRKERRGYGTIKRRGKRAIFTCAVPQDNVFLLRHASSFFFAVAFLSHHIHKKYL
jgi:hypothetical protein